MQIKRNTMTTGIPGAHTLLFRKITWNEFSLKLGYALVARVV